MKTKLLLGTLALANLFTYAVSIRIMGMMLIQPQDDEDTLGLILGSDKDQWGCIPTAGYTWCNETESCIPINQICSNYSSVL